jgi:hypothetical protein
VVNILSYAPVAAAIFGVPQFLPQIRKLRATGDSAGVSWAWAALTTVSNAAWIGYFALSRYWIALIPSCSVTLLAGTLTVLLSGQLRALPGRPRAPRRAAVAVGAWAVALAAAGGVTGRAGLGALLTAAFLVQVAPSLWTAYRTATPSGISAGTWALILGELACFLAYGAYESDPRLIVLGVTGVTASVLMLARIGWLLVPRRRGEPGCSLPLDGRIAGRITYQNPSGRSPRRHLTPCWHASALLHPGLLLRPASTRLTVSFASPPAKCGTGSSRDN